MHSAIHTIACTSATARSESLFLIALMNCLSILMVSIGRPCRRLNDEYPVLNSPTDIVTPICRRLSSCEVHSAG